MISKITFKSITLFIYRPVKGKGKGKGKTSKPKEDTRVWIPCPLLPGVPSVPPPHVPQPWEIKRSRGMWLIYI